MFCFHKYKILKKETKRYSKKWLPSKEREKTNDPKYIGYEQFSLLKCEKCSKRKIKIKRK